MLRLPSYTYHRPESLDDALALMDTHRGDAMYIAGGTDLVPNMKHRLFEPGHLIALKGVQELGGIEEDGTDVRIGAGETLTSVARHDLVRSLFPALADAAAHVAGPQLRNAGTIGGNLTCVRHPPCTMSLAMRGIVQRPGTVGSAAKLGP